MPENFGFVFKNSVYYVLFWERAKTTFCTSWSNLCRRLAIHQQPAAADATGTSTAKWATRLIFHGLLAIVDPYVTGFGDYSWQFFRNSEKTCLHMSTAKVCSCFGFNATSTLHAWSLAYGLVCRSFACAHISHPCPPCPSYKWPKIGAVCVCLHTCVQAFVPPSRYRLYFEASVNFKDPRSPKWRKGFWTPRPRRSDLVPGSSSALPPQRCPRQLAGARLACQGAGFQDIDMYIYTHTHIWPNMHVCMHACLYVCTY